MNVCPAHYFRHETIRMQFNEEYSDVELYERLQGSSGEREAAFAELYARHSQRIYLYCRRVLGENVRAEDLFQETFLRFLKTADARRSIQNVPAYLLRIARNLCLDAKKDAKTIKVEFQELRFPVVDSALERKELARLIAMALDLLPDEHREAFVLQAYDGMSYNEIAAIVGVPLTTIRNRIVRAKKKIRDILAPYFEEYRK